MKFTLSWLKDHLETTATLDEITAALTDLGLEVEDVVNPAARLAPFTIAKVIDATQHPDADKLRVCRVLTDEGEKQIVCGAPNARAGINVVLCKPGDYVPGIDLTLGIGKIRGVESHGMMASERELELSDEHDGIIELSSGEVGQKFVDWLAHNQPAAVDPMIYIKITPNRPDALGVRGIARDLAARGIGVLKELNIPTIHSQFDSPISVQVDAELRKKGCPHFAGRFIKGVKNGPSPAWLQARLKAIGLRPISALVDITNYFTFDLNRPLHVFDADKIKGNVLRIHPSQNGDSFLALDAKEYQLKDGMMVISDEVGIESLAGIMGGDVSGCSDKTTNIFLESAYWDPITIATTGRALKINSDARYRFERGVDPDFTLTGLDMATQMILDLCAGEPSHISQDGAPLNTARSYSFDVKRTEQLIGMDIPKNKQQDILTALGFSLSGNQATPPSWRPDILGEADLVEEIARIASLSKLQGKPLPKHNTGIPKPILTPLQQRERTARRSLAALGFNECVSYSFIGEDAAKTFGGGHDMLRIDNPISSEMTHMRPDLLAGLLQAAARNQARGFLDLRLSEVGPVFSGGEPGEQHICAAGLMVGHNALRDPYASRRAFDIYDAKAALGALLNELGAPERVQINRKTASWWHPGRSGVVGLGPNMLASFGELHPRVLQKFDIKGPAVAFNVQLENIPFPKVKSPTRAALKINDLQAVERDFAFVVDERVEAATAVSAAIGADKELIKGVRVFDYFAGPKAQQQMGEGKKSIAMSVRMQPGSQTLTDADIETTSRKIIEKVMKATGGSLRE